MPAWLRLLGAAVCLLLGAGGAPALAAEFGYQGTHILTGGALVDLAAAFGKKHGLTMPVKGGGCADGAAVVIHDRYELGGLCCPLPAESAAKHGLISHRVAQDIKAVIVNPQNTVADLPLAQIAAMHQGKIRHWREVGVDFSGADRPVAVVFRDHCRNMDEPVRRLLRLNQTALGKAILVHTDQEIVDYVAEFPTAIGVVSRIFAESAKVKMIAVDGIAPTPAQVEEKKYPLVGDLFILTKDPPSGPARRFLDFVLSAEGQAIVGRNFGRVR